MKSEFLRHNGTSQLSIFFSGWGCDGKVCQPLNTENDVLVFWDYRSWLNFETSYFKNYDSVKVTAWSLGVWVANQCLTNYDIKNVASATAINGTLQPIDEECGINPAIFNGTLNGLNERNLFKFRRRMCGDQFQKFMELDPSMDVMTLTAELQALADGINSNGEAKNNQSRIWTDAIIGKNDLIFLTEAQEKSWKEAGVKIKKVDCCHYSSELFLDI